MSGSAAAVTRPARVRAASRSPRARPARSPCAVRLSPPRSMARSASRPRRARRAPPCTRARPRYGRSRAARVRRSAPGRGPPRPPPCPRRCVARCPRRETAAAPRRRAAAVSRRGHRATQRRGQGGGRGGPRPGADRRTRAARDRPYLGRARVQGGARRARLGRDAERAIDLGGDNRTAHGDRAGRARGERDAARPPAGRVTAPALRDILGTARTIAVVGLSPRPTRPSHAVARYLQGAGYRIVPVNPGHATILGEKSYPTLTAAAADQAIDVVDVFRRSEYVA